MIEKKRIRLLAVTAALGVGLLYGCGKGPAMVTIDGEQFPENAAVYDLTAHDLTVESYRQICAEYPDAEILWMVPFQGSRYPMDTSLLTVSSLTREEADSLALFPALQTVDGTACADPDALVYLQAQRPELEVRWQVTLGSSAYDNHASDITAEDADPAQLTTAIPQLPELQTVTLTGKLPSAEAVLQLQADFPGVTFRYTVNRWGLALDQDTTEIDLHGVAVNAQELSGLLPLFPRLENLNLQDTGLSDAALKDIIRQVPQAFVLCTLDFAGLPFSTDETVIDISEHPITAQETEQNLAFFPRLETLYMSFCGIDDETMDALNKSHPDTHIVWTVIIGRDKVRTDTKFFYPAGITEANMPTDAHLVNLKYCPDIIAMDLGHSDVSNCNWAPYLPHLRYLIIADTKVSDLTPLSCLKELVYLEVFRSKVNDYSPLVECTALQDLNLGLTHGDPEPLSRMTWLHNLKWNMGASIPETRDRVLMLPEQLPNTNVILDSDGRSIGEPWRYLPHYYVFRDIIGGYYFNQYWTEKVWGADTRRIMATEPGRPAFAGDVLAELVEERLAKGLPIPGLKNNDSPQAQALLESLRNSHP